MAKVVVRMEPIDLRKAELLPVIGEDVRTLQALLNLFLTAACCVAQPPRGPIVAIDFYGGAIIDFTRLRAVIPFQVGDLFEKGPHIRSDRQTSFRNS